MNAVAVKAITSALGSDKHKRKISLSKLFSGDNSEWLKYILLVKPELLKEIFEERGLTLDTNEDYLAIPKIMDLGLDKKGIEGSKGRVSFNLGQILQSTVISKDKIKASNVTFVE